MSAQNSSPSPSSKPQRFSGPFGQLPLVIGVAALLATLFTLWTPVNFMSGGLAERLAIFAQPTPQVGAAPTPGQLALRVGVVAGHYGNDSGAVCDNGYTEAQLNLDIATRVKADLEAKGYQVQLLKEFDPGLEGYKATAMVSIHTDSCEYVNDEATGYKVSASMANQRPEQAARLVACLRHRYGIVTGLPFHPSSVTPDMTSYHAFEEIDPETPAAIIEIGFLNLDYKFLTGEPEKIAQGVTSGMLCYLNNENVPTTLPTPTITP